MPRFSSKANAAIAEAERLTAAEPERAEAWFYLGAAYGVRAQWRVYRVERLAAARDGKRIKEALERALALDPAMHDAEFGIGMYRYYAGVAPAIFKFLRWLLLLPGGDRVDGPARSSNAPASRASWSRGEAQYQIHVLYLWYEHKSTRGARARPRRCRRAIRTTRSSTRSRRRSSTSTSTITPRSLKASERLLALAASRAVYRADIAEVARAAEHGDAARALAARSRARIDSSTRSSRSHRRRLPARCARARQLRRDARATLRTTDPSRRSDTCS